MAKYGPYKSMLDIGAGFGYQGLLKTPVVTGCYSAAEPDPNLRFALAETWGKMSGMPNLNVFAEIRGGQFDIVVMSEVLEHLKDPADQMWIVYDSLLPGGKLFIEVPHRDDRFKADVWPHLHFFSLPGLEKLISDGFDLLEIGVWGKPVKESPLNKNASPWVGRFETLLNAMLPVLPCSISSRIFARHFGINERCETGTWIRAMARKR